MLSCFFFPAGNYLPSGWLLTSVRLQIRVESEGGSDKCVDEWQHLRGIFPTSWHNQMRIIRQILLPRTMCWFSLVFERNSNSILDGFLSPRTPSASFLSIAVNSLCRMFLVRCKKSIVNWNIFVESEMNIWMLDSKAAFERRNQIHLTGSLVHRCQLVWQFNQWP